MNNAYWLVKAYKRKPKNIWNAQRTRFFILSLRSMEKVEIDLIIPYYNPPEGWEAKLIEKVHTLEREFHLDVHVILVDDGTCFLTEDAKYQSDMYLRKQLINIQITRHITNQGKGSALRTGLKLSNRSIIIMSDVTFPYVLQNIHGLVQLINDDVDVVLAKRQTNYYMKLTFLRLITSITISLILKCLLGKNFVHVQAGLKGLSNRGKSVYLNTRKPGYLADFEFAFLCKNEETLRVKRIECQLSEDYVPSIYGLKKALKNVKI